MTRPTRSQLVMQLVTEAVLRCRLPWNAYAGLVVEHYHATVPITERSWEFSVATTAENFEKASRLNTQTVRRILTGERRMCVDIEESLVAALPEAEREHVVAMLLDRNGLLLARKPADADDSLGQVRSACSLMRKAAQAVEAIAPMLEDNGTIGPEDAQHFPAALEAVNSVQGACVTVVAQVTAAMRRAQQVAA